MINVGFRAERAVSPCDGGVWWVVLDAELVVHREASAFLACLQGADRSPHTIRAYAGRAALFLGAGQGVDWRHVELAELARFKHWAEVSPTRAGRVRSGATVNAILTAACEFLRFCARAGWSRPWSPTGCPSRAGCGSLRRVSTPASPDSSARCAFAC